MLLIYTYSEAWRQIWWYNMKKHSVNGLLVQLHNFGERCVATVDFCKMPLAYIVQIIIPMSSTLSQLYLKNVFVLVLVLVLFHCCWFSYQDVIIFGFLTHFPQWLSFPPIYGTLSCESWEVICDALIWWWWFLWMSDQTWCYSRQYRLNPLLTSR